MDTAAETKPGTVVWVDLSTSDVDEATRFYERLLGWRCDTQDYETGRYVVARTEAGYVAGMMAQSSDEVESGAPPAWTPFIATADMDATVRRSGALGGSVLQPPMPLPDGGRVAAVADPPGASVGLMQSPPSSDVMVHDRPGSVTWVECLTRDLQSARHYYHELFGWQDEEGTDGYVVFSVEGKRIGGLMATPPEVPADVPSYWLVYFAVDDVETVCARAPELGGEVVEPVHEIDEGRFAVLADPAGAVFAVFEPAGQD